MINPDRCVQSEALKSLYYQHRTALLMDGGELVCCDFDSPAIPLIQAHVNQHYSDYGFDSQPDLPVRFVEAALIERALGAMRQEGQPLSPTLPDSETASRARDAFERATALGASDLHIEVLKDATHLEARVDGRMVPLMAPIAEQAYGLAMMAYLFNELCVDKDDDFYQGRPNNGRLSLPLTTPEGPRQTHWRASYIPAAHQGGQCTLRWTNKTLQVPQMTQLGWEPGHIAMLRTFIHSASGIALLAGQTSSGKSTVIAAILNEIKRQGRSVNTLEDPAEFDLGLIQTSVPRTLESGFAEYAKLLLRHDVDIEMHGEVRDHQGAMSMCRKGETGQIMLSTIHTSSALGIAHTLHAQMGIPRALLAAPGLMKLWVYQTLVRTLCPHCKVPLERATLDEAKAHQLAHWQAAFPDVNRAQMALKHPQGCPHCTQGERGRTALLEMLVIDDEDRRFILEGDAGAWQRALCAKGFKDIVHHANVKIARGEIDLFSAAEKVDGLFPLQSEAVYHRFWETT